MTSGALRMGRLSVQLINFDIYRETAGETVAPNLAAASAADDDFTPASKRPAFSGYTALSLEATDDVPAEEEEDFGGLMVRDQSRHACSLLIGDDSRL